MNLSELLRAAPARKVAGSAEIEVAGMTHDSRELKPGYLFFALQGSKTDGNRHIKDAAARGASVIVSELEPPPAPLALTATWVQVADITAAMGLMADFFYGHPSGAMTVIGVTGTNGKTTTTYFLESIISACGGLPAVAGTINYRLGGRVLEDAVNTTPISAHIQRLLARFRDENATHVAMEVSSHALALGRVDQVDFDAAIFTNLKRDHLDFHKTREEYFEAKARLFELLGKPSSTKKRPIAVLNADDPTCESLKRRCAFAQVATYGLGAASHRAEDVEMSLGRTRFTIVYEGRRLPVEINLVGEHNVYNALGAASAALALGMDAEGVRAGLKNLSCVPGRLEPVDAGQDFHVFVDYAHTDSALETVLAYLTKLPHRKLITVVGCGGDRDRSKRGPMGSAACRTSDQVIITSDNPRSEDPLSIISDIEEGLKTAGHKNYKIEADRSRAIGDAIAMAGAGDVVLIAGKGHENYQILKDRTIHFDDRETALQALRSKTQ